MYVPADVIGVRRETENALSRANINHKITIARRVTVYFKGSGSGYLYAKSGLVENVMTVVPKPGFGAAYVVIGFKVDDKKAEMVAYSTGETKWSYADKSLTPFWAEPENE
ncbi:TPA: hypothetical protein DD449_03920 [Candidatus Berkelbacteria bacterium]|uniref:Uncharacterized protein n=1 Tax=Berkelbacteria bacterium GW2011_GWE1_39_12 TaxID=1618337 RepID=A0A0G4B2S2_9BACT|nr:MAG: hypothetical protein UT28_C0001G0420 [Berkelbacteria bacterium GW2011_GWE1_39_12]HBO60804.1 hypothetical protein [Candidatus Berkelbacteria bacterium]